MDRDFIYRALQNGSPEDHRALLALFAARPPFGGTDCGGSRSRAVGILGEPSRR